MAAIETATEVSIISRALLLCQEHAIDSTNNERYGTEVGSNLFAVKYENEIQSNPWRFSMKKAALSRLNLTPVNQYKYVFQIPSDCLLPRFVYPSTDYEIYGDRVYANQLSVDLDYQFKPDVAAVPAYFSLLMSYCLAVDMVTPVTGSVGASEAMLRRYVIQRDRAMYADSQGRPAKRVQSSPFTEVRGGAFSNF